MKTDYEASRSVGRLDRLGGCLPHWERSRTAFDRRPKPYRDGYTAGWCSISPEREGTERHWRTDAQRNAGRPVTAASTEPTRAPAIEQLTDSRGLTLTAKYPCCGKRCRLKVLPETRQHEVVERDHFCSSDDEVGTRWRVERQLISFGGEWRADRVTFLDMASDEANRLYGRRYAPTRRDPSWQGGAS